MVQERIRKKLTGKALENFRANTNYRQRKCRLKKRKRLINNKPLSFQNCQSFGKVIKKVTSALPKCDKKKKDVIQHLAQKYNLAPKPVQQRTCANISDQIKNVVHKFYLRDNVSYQLSENNTFDNLRESFELFIEENKGIIISRSSFADLRPPFVDPKAALAHRICVCIYHENANLILKAIDKFVKGNVCSSLQQFTGTLVCNTVNQECMFLACPLCEKLNGGNGSIKNGRAEKKEFEGSVDKGVELLKSKVKYFLFHVYIKREQSKYFEQLKSEVTDEKVVIQVDFAENFGLVSSIGR
ncbi:unnamed protein product [Didymodactylos carnosus]|uniref:Uncharacterized protein n=1 Tax=Didymodactylos carnosus TaxID=1234261 RepID=A0A8S2D718_9BILA|nr:unnamed protein product [Didymodactylos carnosus]CAF3606238.1 unnamed protein product [Didymodactylos carnosus]